MTVLTVRSLASRVVLVAGGLAATASSARGQEELLMLLPPTLKPVAHFGAALAVAKGYVLASDHTAGPQKHGRAHVFNLRTGQRVHVLKADDPSFLFGGALAMNERWVLASSRHSTPSHFADGAVYVFETGTWQRMAKITAPDGHNNQYFGGRIAVDGDLALIGAPGDQTVGNDSGAAYLMDLPTGALIHKWIGSDTVAGDNLSFVALDARRAVVGSAHHQSGTGAAYVFDVATGQELHKLQGSGTHPASYFGWPIVIDDGKALIGAYSEDDRGVDRSGAAYLFDLETGMELRRFSSSSPTQRAQFGSGLELDGRYAYIGVPGDGNFFTDLGRVEVYDLETGALRERFAPADNGVGDLFGRPMAKDGCRLVVGAPWRDDLGPATGAAFVFGVLGELGEVYCSPANLNSTGTSGRILAEGSECLGDDRLTLHATDLPSNQFGYFLASQTQDFIANPGGSQGNLCLGGNIDRFVKQVLSSGCDGSFSLNVPQWAMPGQTWNFQAWFRDNNPGPTSNFTDGVSITFS